MTIRVLSRADSAAHDTTQWKLGQRHVIASRRQRAPPAPPEPGCHRCPEGVNDHGDLTRIKGDQAICCRCGEVIGK